VIPFVWLVKQTIYYNLFVFQFLALPCWRAFTSDVITSTHAHLEYKPEETSALITSSNGIASSSIECNGVELTELNNGVNKQTDKNNMSNSLGKELRHIVQRLNQLRDKERYLNQWLTVSSRIDLMCSIIFIVVRFITLIVAATYLF